MTGRGLRSILPSYSFGHHHGHHHHGHRGHRSPHQQTLSDAVIKEQVTAVESILAKWDAAPIAFLFHDDRAEAREFLAAVRDLQDAMLFFVSADESGAAEAASHATLVRGQTLMQASMRCLEKEFCRILADIRHSLDPESFSGRSSTSSTSVSDDDELREVGDSAGEVDHGVAMTDLRAIADTMISVGYGKECVKAYEALRRSVVDVGLHRLGFERLSPSQVQKLDCNQLDRKIKSWLRVSHAAAATLFTGERILLDHVFTGFDSIREVIFADIARDAAIQLLCFPEMVAKSKRSTEKIFRILELYDAVAEMLPEIQAVFSFASTAAVLEQAFASLSKLSEAARASLADFEAAVHKEHSKSLPAGGGIHPLTRDVMDYIATLAEYELSLAEIFADFPLQNLSSHPEFFLDMPHTEAAAAERTYSLTSSSSSSTSSKSSNDDDRRSAVAVRLAWLILILLCKLDGKAAAYRHAGLSYLFLANNLHYVVSKVRSCRLRGMLGEEWLERCSAKARQHAAGYEKVAWGKVTAAMPAGKAKTPAEARGRMLAFNAALEEVCTEQARWVVTDGEVRDAVKAAALRQYQEFYEQWRAALEDEKEAKLSPEDVRQRLAELFAGAVESDSFSSSSYRLGSDSGSVRSVASSRLNNAPTGDSFRRLIANCEN